MAQLKNFMKCISWTPFGEMHFSENGEMYESSCKPQAQLLIYLPPSIPITTRNDMTTILGGNRESQPKAARLCDWRSKDVSRSKATLF